MIIFDMSCRSVARVLVLQCGSAEEQPQTDVEGLVGNECVGCS